MGKINASGKIMVENQKKDWYGNKRYFYINLRLKDRLDIEFIACLGEVVPQVAWHHLPFLTNIAILTVRTINQSISDF